MSSEHPSTTTTVYTCPMHPEVQQDRPGKCPKCGMNLVPKTRGERRPGPAVPKRRQPREREGREHFATPVHEEPGAMPEMTRDMRRSWLWTNSTLIMLGLWLVSSPLAFGFSDTRMLWSDMVSGVLLAVLAGAAFAPRFDFIGRWGAAFVGAWLQFAPLVFWAKLPVEFVNDTLIGALAIALSVLVPMMPGMAHHMEMRKPGPVIPPGWTYNPSSWHQRAPMIVAAFLGWILSRYLAAFQLGYVPHAWDPFFGNSTEAVLTSNVSRMWPISDAGLGAVAYTFEMLMAWMGGKTRWRTMPWMVTFFFILVVPLGVTSIVLVILQPVAVGHWCAICLATALVMLVMIPFTVDEVVAMGQFLRRSVREGKSFWRTFWVGGTLDEENEDKRTPAYGAPAREALPAAAWGVTVPWTLLASAGLGIWLMFAPAVFDTAERAADSDHLVGALVTTVAVIVMAEVFRAGRYLNVLLGAWIIAAPWLLAGTSTGARLNDLAVGVLVIALSIPRGIIRQRYATWDRLIV